MVAKPELDEFREIAHSGGTITFDVGGDGTLQLGFASSRPVPTALIEVYALPNGRIVEQMRMVGLGERQDPPSFPGCFPVIIASDGEGRFGHNCPRCKGYWRSGPWSRICPYCGLHAPGIAFISEAQQRYAIHYCTTLATALEAGQGKAAIDMDAVADATGGLGEKPAHYVSDESQQRKFICGACGEFNDITGRYGFCSRCGTRADLAEFEEAVIPGLRDRLNNGDPPETCLREAVAAFDALASQYAKQLAAYVPMTDKRRARLTKKRFQDVAEMRKIFGDWFDIDIADGIKDDDFKFAEQKFLRRHLYEHTGGEVDEKYLAESGDTSVRLKQQLRETKEDIHRLLGVVLRMAKNLHLGFHSVMKPQPEPIRAFEEKKKRMAAK